MQKTFTVTVTEEDGPSALNDYMHGPDWHLVVSTVSEWLRQKLKYEDVKTIDTQEVRSKLYEIAGEYGIVIDE